MELTPDQRTALETARALTRAGIPVFAAPPDPAGKIGFRLPPRWQQTKPDPAAVDAWQPGWALCMVCGCGLDLVDLDLYAGNGASQVTEVMPRRYALATTPSGGVHVFTAPIGVASMNNLLPGVDIKSGGPGGKGRGFAFIAPTVRPSKTSGQPGTYLWQVPPDLAALAGAAADESTRAIAELVTAKRGSPAGANGHQGPAAAPAGLTPHDFMRERGSPWADARKTLAEGRNDGVMRLAASLRSRTSWAIEQATAYMYEHAWPLIDQGQGGHDFTEREFEEVIQAVWREYPGADDVVRQAAIASADLAAHPLPGTALELTDAYITDRTARGMLHGQFCWARGLGWMKWDSRCWSAADASEVWDATRQYFIWLHRECALTGADHLLLARLSALLAKSRIAAITDLARGHPAVIRGADDFDAHPDLINTPAGVTDLRTGKISAHDPALLLTKITSGSYREGFTHPDWELALTALDPPEREWFRLRAGQAITGHPPSDGIMPVLQGGGENGKSCLTTDGPVRALGGYADMASPKLIASQRANSSEHSTELADLRGQRLLVGEELTEGRSIDVAVLKRIQDVGRIKARYVHKDNITFTATHSLFLTTNYMPVINETDHGTWRRLALLVFRYHYRKPGEDLAGPNDRAGDPGLKHRIKKNASGQHDAIVTWAIDGARAWYAASCREPAPTPVIAADTLAWRSAMDQILGFWQARLAADQGTRGSHPPCITAHHLLDVFNTWLTLNSHGPWSHQTFAARFQGHEVTVGHGVEYRVSGRLGNLSWDAQNGRFSIPQTVPKQARVWTGVRFQTAADQPEYGSLDGLDGGKVKLSNQIPHEGFTFPLSSPSSYPPVTSLSDHSGGFPAATGREGIQDLLETPDGPSAPSATDTADVTHSDDAPGKAPSPPKRKKAAARPAGPDPELAGPAFTLPVIVNRQLEITPVAVADAAAVIGSVAGADLTVDVETTGYPVGHPDYALRTIQLGNAELAAVFDAADPHSRDAVSALLGGARVLRAHSAAADLVPLGLAGLCGADAWDRMHDTVLAAKLADPAMSGSDADGLKALAADVLKERAVTPAANQARKKLFASGRWLSDTDALTPAARSGWAQVDPACQTMIRYAASDVLDTAALAGALPPSPPEVSGRERAVQRICARVSWQGLALDGGHIGALIREHEQGRDAAAALVRARGIENPGSARQVAAALAELGAVLPATGASVKFPAGQPSAAGSVLDAVAGAGGEAGELARDVLAYREHATILGLTLEPFAVLCGRGDGRVRPVVYTLGTSTGRMSCVRPNLQQIKREGGIRACITADDGAVIISADFAGVELRVAAALSRDAALQEFIAAEDAGTGDGLHWLVARQVWGADATKSNRYAVKRAVFGHIYGGSVAAMAAGAGITMTDAAAVKQTLARLTPDLMQWSAGLSEAVRAGRVSWFPTAGGRAIWLDKRYPHKAGNYAIQGTARELLADALLRWAAGRWGDSVVLPVHDEILALVPEADGQAATAELIRCMETRLDGVAIVAEPSEPSFAWADAV